MYKKTIFAVSAAVLIIALVISCEPWVDTFDKIEKAKIYKSGDRQNYDSIDSTIHVMTWNIRFGAGRLPWFGDSCGDRVILKKREVLENLQRIADAVNSIQPDILLLNEIDVESKRSAYINQVKWLLNHTGLNYGAYASAWKVQFIPSDGLGKMDMGNAILSRWPIKSATRIKLALRNDQDSLTKYFYLRRNLLKITIDLPLEKDLVVVNGHLAAFSTDNTKHKHITKFLEVLDDIDTDQQWLIAGGDFNMLPPGSDSTDYCLEDICGGESFHRTGDKPFHKEGSNYTPEEGWMDAIYGSYLPAVPLARYQSQQQKYFTHTTDPGGFWDRKLDYLFSNFAWQENSDSTYQNLQDHSDHAAVSAIWKIPQ